MNHGRLSRWLSRWLLGINLGLVLVGLILGVWVTRRGYFLAALVLIAFAPFSYARLRLHRFLAAILQPRHGVLFGLAVAGVFCDAVLIAQLVTARSAEALPVVQWAGVAWVGPVWFSAHVLLLLGYALGGLGRSGYRLVRWLGRLGRDPHPEPQPVSLERRQFLQQAGVVGAGLPFFLSLSGVSVSYDFRVEEREITLPHWPRSLDGLRVVHLSDIHVGGAMNRERLLRVAELAQACRPDLVLHTGDFLTHRSGEFDAPLYEALGRLKAPYGQWACFGNHDFDDPERLVRRLREAGVTVLRNERAVIHLDRDDVEVAGLDFVFNRAQRAAQNARFMQPWARRDAPRLLLNHDPSGFATLPDGCADLVLSGHTHGGHIGVQLGPSHALTVVGLAGIPDQGLFERPDMRMYVTRCVGFYGYPMRVGIPPEIALLILRTPRPSAGDARSA